MCGALLAYDAAGGASPYAGLDVERVFAAVEPLTERRTLEVSPFVAAWHPAVDAWDRPREPAFFGKDFKRALTSPPPAPRRPTACAPQAGQRQTKRTSFQPLEMDQLSTVLDTSVLVAL